MKSLKKIFTLALVLMMVLSLTVPALAADDHTNHTITITEGDTGHIFEAYQIFSGKVAVVDGDSILTDPEWGTSVDTTKTVNWGTIDDPKELTLLQALADSAVNPSYYNLYTAAATAKEVTDILSTSPNNTTAHAMEFATIIGEYLKEAPVSSANEPVALGTNPETYGYVIEGLSDGYYLVKEKDGNDVSPATHTSYILQLVDDVTVNVKAGDVTVDKKIVDGSSQVTAADYSIGDTVTFKLEGRLPANYVRFYTYEYAFVDTLSEGLTYAGNVRVQFDNDGNVVDVDPSQYVVSLQDPAADADLVSDNLPTGATTFYITFPDLKATGAAGTNYTVNRDTKIIVYYDAVVNVNAEIGNPGNPNEVYIEFDNDPYNEGKGKTEKKEVTVFTFELDVTKVDGKDATAIMAGVEFQLYREHAGKQQWVKLDADGKVIGWADKQEDGSVITVDEDNKVEVIGLEASEYTLVETNSLPGYNKIAPITFNIEKTLDLTQQVVTALRLVIDGQPEVPGDTTTGIVAMEVENNPGNTLPETGGMGTTLFYVFGTIMVAAAIVLLVTKKRMAA